MEMVKTPEETMHENAVAKEQEQIQELLRRGAVRHYFLGPENIWSQEGFGTVVGGVLTGFLGGILLPKLFLYSNTNAALQYMCWLMTAAGIFLILKGLHGMKKEYRVQQKQVSDQTFDEILAYDLVKLGDISKALLKENIPKLAEEENLEQMEMVLVRGPRDYVHNVNLPLLWKQGEDGFLRYSNFSVMALYFGNENLYIYTSIYNMRNGTSKFQHTYECPYDKIRYTRLEDRVIDTVNQKNKAISGKLQVLVINAGDREEDELVIPVRDYDLMEQMQGDLDICDAETAIQLIINKIKE